MNQTWRAQRLSELPPYLFAEIEERKRAARDAGRDIIDLGVGDPDAPTPEFIVEAMIKALADQRNHKYAIGTGKPEFKREVADFMRHRFDVRLDPDKEVLALLGSKEGLGHLPIAVLNPGEVTLVPQPAYPVYFSSTVFAGGVPHILPLKEAKGWLPDLDAIPSDVLGKARILFLNYPNNPTAACADLEFFAKAVQFARDHNLLIVQDAAYTELHFGPVPPSILQVPGAKDVAIEIHSLSKTFNMTGWRIGFAVGNAQVLAALAKVKSNLDSGIFGAVQDAGTVALHNCDNVEIRAQKDIYRQRRDLLMEGLRGSGWKVTEPKATFYLWAGCPDGVDSMRVATRALDEADVVVVPGAGFGPAGEGYCRFALTVNEERTKEVVRRLRRIEW
jgi:LL-diaminopimelate aminotransferase